MKTWVKEIQDSGPLQRKDIDVLKTYEQIIFENMSKICFGSNILDKMIELTVNGKQKPMNIVDVVHTMSAQLGTAAMYRKLNPIGAMYYALTRKTVNLTKFTKAVANNCRVTRDFLRSLIQQRKSEQMKSEVGGNADLLSLFLSSPDIFTDDDIIDELVDFLLAGTQTTAYAILTMLSHLAKSKESMQAVRAEFNKSASIPSTEGEGSEVQQIIGCSLCWSIKSAAHNKDHLYFSDLTDDTSNL